jgi:hypothetical protein
MKTIVIQSVELVTDFDYRKQCHIYKVMVHGLTDTGEPRTFNLLCAYAPSLDRINTNPTAISHLTGRSGSFLALTFEDESLSKGDASDG